MTWAITKWSVLTFILKGFDTIHALKILCTVHHYLQSFQVSGVWHGTPQEFTTAELLVEQTFLIVETWWSTYKLRIATWNRPPRGLDRRFGWVIPLLVAPYVLRRGNTGQSDECWTPMLQARYDTSYHHKSACADNRPF